jgi:Rap/ran-GAP
MKDPLRKKVFSIGLLHSLRGQTEEHEQFCNNTQTPLLQEFMAFLGDKIKLPGWAGYRGDLDVDTGSTGEYGLFRRWKGFEIMFHASTLLPFQEGTTEQLHRKRRIGNDVGVVIFQEGGTYTPPIRSQMLHAYYIVSPVVKDGVTYYRLAVTTREGTPEIQPPVPDPPLFPKTPAFRTFLLSKIVNGVLASMNHPALREKIWCHPKEVFLSDLVARYGKSQHMRQLRIKKKK